MFDLLLIDGFLDPPARERILAELVAASTAPATVYGGEKPIDRRTRKTSHVVVSEATRELVIARLVARKSEVEGHFGQTLGEVEAPQFLRYDPGDYFVAHQDGNTDLIRDDSRHRKISIVIFLSDPARYRGGALTFHGRYPNYEQRLPLTPAPGTLVAFRAETTHEVTPLEHGQRYTIVSWYR